MADDNATRQRRKRAHARGDHSLCRVESCAGLRVSAPAGRVTAAAQAFVAKLDLAVDDPRRLDAEVLLALAPRVDAGDTTAAREFRAVLAAVSVGGSASGDWLDELRARRRTRRASHGWTTMS